MSIGEGAGAAGPPQFVRGMPIVAILETVLSWGCSRISTRVVNVGNSHVRRVGVTVKIWTASFSQIFALSGVFRGDPDIPASKVVQKCSSR